MEVAVANKSEQTCWEQSHPNRSLASDQDRGKHGQLSCPCTQPEVSSRAETTWAGAPGPVHTWERVWPSQWCGTNPSSLTQPLTKAHTPGKKWNQHRSAAVSPRALPHNQKQPNSLKAPAPAPQPPTGSWQPLNIEEAPACTWLWLEPLQLHPCLPPRQGLQHSLGKTQHTLTSDLTLPSKPLVTGKLPRDASSLLVGCKLVQSLQKTVWSSLKKPETELQIIQNSTPG